MSERMQRSLGTTAFWFALSVLVLGVNLYSAVRGGGLRWLALLLAGLAAWMAYRHGMVLLAWYRDRQARSSR